VGLEDPRPEAGNSKSQSSKTSNVKSEITSPALFLAPLSWLLDCVSWEKEKAAHERHEHLKLPKPTADGQKPKAASPFHFSLFTNRPRQ
jgi:hypothetical protein